MLTRTGFRWRCWYSCNVSTQVQYFCPNFHDEYLNVAIPFSDGFKINFLGHWHYLICWYLLFFNTHTIKKQVCLTSFIHSLGIKDQVINRKDNLLFEFLIATVLSFATCKHQIGWKLSFLRLTNFFRGGYRRVDWVDFHPPF